MFTYATYAPLVVTFYLKLFYLYILYPSLSVIQHISYISFFVQPLYFF